MARFNERGQEIPDDTPLAIPLGMKKPESLVEMMRRLIRSDVSRFAQDQGEETFEEANDFDVEEDDAELHSSPYELMTDEVPRAQAKPEKPHGDNRTENEASETERSDEDEDEEPRPRARRRARARERPEAELDPEEDPEPSRRARPRRKKESPVRDRHEDPDEEAG